MKERATLGKKEHSYSRVGLWDGVLGDGFKPRSHKVPEGNLIRKKDPW